MVSIIFVEKAVKQLELVPLSNDTISRRILDLTSNVKEQLVEKVKASKYVSI